jgi:hypothetical protein
MPLEAMNAMAFVTGTMVTFTMVVMIWSIGPFLAGAAGAARSGVLDSVGCDATARSSSGDPGRPNPVRDSPSAEGQV